MSQHFHEYAVQVHDVSGDVRVDRHAPATLAKFGVVHVGPHDDQFQHEVARRLLAVLRQAADDLENGMATHPKGT
jgi:hypothetical protein